jgi:hypothetical protein
MRTPGDGVTRETLKVVTFCLTRAIEVRPGLTRVDPADLQHFMMRHFEALNAACERWGVPDSVNQEISEAVIRTLVE